MPPAMKQYEVILSDVAIAMLEEHLNFIALASKAKAHKTNAEIFKAIFSLDTMPERYPYLCDDCLPKNQYHKMNVEKWYLILYQIKDDSVYVDYIIDCRQDSGWLGL